MSKDALFALRHYLGFFGRLEEEEWNALVEQLQPFSYPANTHLVRQGDETVRLYFLLQGYARHYFLDAEGEEISNWFNIPGSMATDYEAYTTGNVCTYSIVSLTEVQGFWIDRQTLLSLYDRYKNWEHIGRVMNQMYLISLMRRNQRLYSQTAAERYAHFFKTQPGIFQVAKLKHIASYLGITLETLSRLRAKR
jgi:CRP-like cAMP-binding protein